MARETFDVAIVGGGIMGWAAARALRKEGFDGSVVVIERDPTYREGSTGRAVGGVRQQFSTPENIRLTRASLDLISDLCDEFGADGDVGFQERGYLILATASGRPILLENAAVQHAEGAATRVLGPSELAKRFPWLATDGIAAATLGERDEGWLDPASLHNLLRRSASASNVTARTGEVTAIAADGGHGYAVSLSGSDQIGCGILVNAAGAWAGGIAAYLGVELPVGPRKRFVYVLDCRNPPPELYAAPLTVDPTGFYFRPESRHFICGQSPGAADEPDANDLDAIDHSWFEDTIWPALAARIPAFEAVKVINAWAGYYDYNALDQNAIIGPHPDHAGLYFLTGFSGHGVQQAPAAGRAIAELIVHGRFVTLDLERFGVRRILDGTPLRERNMI